MRNIWRAEWRALTRQKSSYTLVILWIFLTSLLFLLQWNNPALTGYTNVTGTILNLILYLVPLFMLIISSFSIANEQENGQWRLLSTYPLVTKSYVAGKLGGLFTAQSILFTLGFGISMLIGVGLGLHSNLKWTVSLYVFSIVLMFLFLVIGVFVGSISSTRWQALSISVALWFLLIMMWPTALISLLGFMPYLWIEPAMKLLLFINPAELLRVLFVVQLDGGSIFGQAYDSLITFFQSEYALLLLCLYIVIFTIVLFSVSTWNLSRRKTQ